MLEAASPMRQISAKAARFGVYRSVRGKDRCSIINFEMS